MSQVTVNLKIHNRSYKIKVDASDEAFIREAAEEVNKQIEGFQKKYRGRDIQDYLALTLITRMTESNKEVDVNEDELIQELDKLAGLIK